MASEPSSSSSRNINGKFIAIGVLALVLVVFALVNTHDVNVDFVVTSVDTSMIVVILVSAVVGFALGWLFAAHRAKRNAG
jgi:uncharacterized integral membrane protein